VIILCDILKYILIGVVLTYNFNLRKYKLINLEPSVVAFVLLKPAAQKEEMDCNSLTSSSRLRVAPIAVPVVLWSLPLFHFVESHLSL
jgi:hypothetical protein